MAVTALPKPGKLLSIQDCPPSVLLSTPSEPEVAYTVEEAVGSIARLRTLDGKGEVTPAAHDWPASVLLRTPLGIYPPA